MQDLELQQVFCYQEKATGQHWAANQRKMELEITLPLNSSSTNANTFSLLFLIG
jgi:hypothetical protein